MEDFVSSRKIIYTEPEKAKEFVQRTGCDFLAVAIGTSHGAYKFKEVFAAGFFLQYDTGTRNTARFSGLTNGKVQIIEKRGGAFTELWIGPYFSVSWKSLFAEIGYALIGTRTDAARDDLPSTTGNLTSAFETSPTVAWILALGGSIPIETDFDVVFRKNFV